jgi:hypothetical protein
MKIVLYQIEKRYKTIFIRDLSPFSFIVALSPQSNLPNALLFP